MIMYFYTYLSILLGKLLGNYYLSVRKILNKMRYLKTGFQLDKRRKSTKGYPVKLRVTYQRQPRYYNTGIYLSLIDFDKLNSINPRGYLKETKIKLESIEAKSIKILNDIEHNFSFDRFKELYLNKPKLADLTSVFDEVIGQLNIEGRVGTADSYFYAKESFRKYVGRNKKIQFNEITKEWLHKYQNYMQEQGKSLTTIGIYTRSLRTAYNYAVNEKIISKDSYPFGKGNYKIPSGNNTKKALTKKEISMIFEYQPEEGTWEEMARDIWIFSYLCNGANIKDICRLKQKNLHAKSIHFIRAKTERTTINNYKNIVVARLPQLDQIIKKHGSISLNPDQYVFPFLTGDETPERELAVTKQVTKNINKWMGRIGEKLEINKKVTTYTARHSFATILKRGGAPIEYISESLGHSDLRTTETYLDSFEDETKEKFAKLLVNFNEEING